VTTYLLFALLLIPLLAGVLGVVLRTARRPRSRARLQARDLLQRDGQAMYLRLRAALPQYIILPRPSLAAFLEVKGGNKSSSRAMEAELTRQTVDFLICGNDFRVVAAVELEDVIRGRRDHEKGASLLRQAAVPVLRWTTVSLPTIRDIQEAIAEVETLRLISLGMEDRASTSTTREYSSSLGRREPRL
jgi:hypothetical protein